MQTTKDIIFNKAARLFSEKGYDNVSTREAARATGVNESTAHQSKGKRHRYGSSYE